ncbi:MAG: co-chaperone GroES [Candidatus Pacebacteria bacterium]|nr:co-chaperone GroES [Candidatus Paceibacterota bacterium]
MVIKPLSDHILVEPVSVEEKTKTGIFLPQSSDKERPEQGKVIAVGPGKISKTGERMQMEVKAGDLVIFTKYGPNEIKVDGKEYLIAKQDDILAILEK